MKAIMNYLDNLIVEPLCNYSNAVRWHESPDCCHDNNDQHIQYGSKANLLRLKQPTAITLTATKITHLCEQIKQVHSLGYAV